MTFFGDANPKFLPIPDDKRVVTSTFLEASDVMVPFFDNFGAVFKPVKNDVAGNIRKIRLHYETDPEKYKTLNDILDETSGKGGKLSDGQIGVVWLTRGLDFIQKMLELIVQDFEEGKYQPDGKMKDLIKSAYAVTLSDFHNIIMKGVFNTACMAAPYKKDFLDKLKTKPDETTNEQVIADMKEYQKQLALTAETIKEFTSAPKFK